MTLSTTFSGTLDSPLGYTHVVTPPTIRHAVRLLASEQLIGGSTLVTDHDAKQVIWPDFTITFKGGGGDLGESTGYPEIDRLS